MERPTSIEQGSLRRAWWLGGTTLIAIVAEGAIAAHAAHVQGLGAGAAASACMSTQLLALGCLAIPSLALWAGTSWTPLRRFVANLARSFGDVGLALIGFSMAASASLRLTAKLSPSLQTMMSPAFAAQAIACLSLLTFVGVWLGLGALAGMLRMETEQAARRTRWLANVMVGASALWVLDAFPTLYKITPTLWLLAWVSLPTEPLATWLVSRRRLLLLTLAVPLAAVAVVGVAWQREHRATEVASLVRGAPWTGQLLAAFWSATDDDGDGFSAQLGGGDCDDKDKKRHPDARDVPGNGIDENCSGADAPGYAPPSPPPPPKGLKLPERPNFVVIQLDALRPDHLHFAGYARPTSPVLDQLAQRSVWFRNAYTTSPSTRFAMTSAFTGYDTRRVPHQRLNGNRFQLDNKATTFAERLSKRGYTATGYSISYVLHHNKGLGQGFAHWDTPWPVNAWEQTYSTAAELTSTAVIDTLKQTPDDREHPFLVFAHYRCTHDPYFKYPRWDYGDRDIDRYDSALNYCDDEIGKVLSAIGQRSDASRTVIVVFSDHGELFGEHGATNHGNTLYEPDVRILMLLHVPGIKPREIKEPVSIADLAPTVLALAGVAGPKDTDGWSLLSLLTDSTAPRPSRPLFMFTDLWRGKLHHQANAVLRWPYKFILDKASRRQELFDVRQDPAEQHDISRAHPALLRELSDLNDAYEAFTQSRKAR